MLYIYIRCICPRVVHKRFNERALVRVGREKKHENIGNRTPTQKDKRTKARRVRAISLRVISVLPMPQGVKLHGDLSHPRNQPPSSGGGGGGGGHT